MCGESGPCPVGFRAFKLKKHLPDSVENDSRTVMTVNKKTCLSDAESHQHAFGPCLCLLYVRQ